MTITREEFLALKCNYQDIKKALNTSDSENPISKSEAWKLTREYFNEHETALSIINQWRDHVSVTNSFVCYYNQ